MSHSAYSNSGFDLLVPQYPHTMVVPSGSDLNGFILIRGGPLVGVFNPGFG